MEEPLRVLNFDDDDDLTSLEHFESKVESRNAPAVFRGCVKDWKAFSLWKPSNGGLDYLEGRVGTSIVEAMLSRSGPIFYGDIRGREMIPLPFSAFITTCKQRLQNSNGSCNVNTDSDSSKLIEPSATGSCLDSMDSHHQVYLAQVPILSMESKERSQLETLREDIQLPSILKSKVLTSINLWMNNAKSRSSTHYDPHHNLLCIVAGCKQVVLWSPSAGPLLYPMPVYGEASNHSAVDLGSPDFSIHPRAKRLMDYSQEVMLHAGDALFIPEGWYHQVDSDELTIAVNYWWQSSMVCNMQEHMDPYFLRILLRRWFILSSITQNPIDGIMTLIISSSTYFSKNV
ncbi:hypothetical protein Scep_030155 [Stephania cephalantha]|uniref:JmjC domain-containing protein n=1 Tax=Stephania cephalantha TaxID=152367 RepID=A0AAP0HE35_9MAGN